MTEYKSLLKVSDTYPFDLVDLSCGHTGEVKHEGNNPVTMLAFFRNKKLEYYVDQKEFHSFGEKLIDTILSDKNWKERLKKKSASFIKRLSKMDTFLKNTDFSTFDNVSLAKYLKEVQGIVFFNGLNFHDENIPSYSLALQERLEKIKL